MKIGKKSIIFMTIGFIILLSIVIMVILFVDEPIIDAKMSDAKKFKRELESYNGLVVRGSLTYPEVNISSDNAIVYSNVDDIVEIFNNNGSEVVYIGYPSCLYCRTAVPILLNAAEENKIDKIYYLDIEKIWFEKGFNEDNELIDIKKSNADYDKLVSVIGDKFLKDYILLNQFFETVDTKTKRLEVPLVLFIVNGRIVSYNIGTLTSQLDPLISFDKYQEEGLYRIYDLGMKDVLKGKKS